MERISLLAKSIFTHERHKCTPISLAGWNKAQLTHLSDFSLSVSLGQIEILQGVEDGIFRDDQCR